MVIGLKLLSLIDLMNHNEAYQQKPTDLPDGSAFFMKSTNDFVGKLPHLLGVFLSFY